MEGDQRVALADRVRLWWLAGILGIAAVCTVVWWAGRPSFDSAGLSARLQDMSVLLQLTKSNLDLEGRTKKPEAISYLDDFGPPKVSISQDFVIEDTEHAEEVVQDAVEYWMTDLDMDALQVQGSGVVSEVGGGQVDIGGVYRIEVADYGGTWVVRVAPQGYAAEADWIRANGGEF